MKTAAQAAAAWRESQGRATQNYTEGVQGYTGDWAGATVAQEQTLLANVTTSITNGAWRRGVTATGTGGWKSATTAKSANYGTGFSAGADKQAKAIANVMNALGTIVPNLPQRGTFAQNKQRALAVMDGLHALKGQLGAR